MKILLLVLTLAMSIASARADLALVGIMITSERLYAAIPVNHRGVKPLLQQTKPKRASRYWASD